MTLPNYLEMSHPEFQEEQREAQQALQNQLRAVAGQINAYRQARTPAPSDRAWAREWSNLGSAKTWAKVLNGDFEHINVAAKLPDYQSVLAALTAMTKERAAEELYQDLGGAQAVALAALRLMLHHGKDRLILVEGGSGSGKTTSLDLLAASGAGGSKIYRLDADETWKSQRVAMRSMLLASGYPLAEIPDGTGAMMETLKLWVKQKGRVTFAIDEAHHVSGTVLNLFKSLLNSTEMLLILAGMATLFQKLRTAASEESKQLIHNRLFCRVKLAGPDESGVREFLTRRLKVPGDWKTSTLKAIAAAAVHAGYWSYLRRIVDQLAADGNLQPDDGDLNQAAVKAAAEIA